MPTKLPRESSWRLGRERKLKATCKYKIIAFIPTRDGRHRTVSLFIDEKPEAQRSQKRKRKHTSPRITSSLIYSCTRLASNYWAPTVCKALFLAPRTEIGSKTNGVSRSNILVGGGGLLGWWGWYNTHRRQAKPWTGPVRGSQPGSPNSTPPTAPQPPQALQGGVKPPWPKVLMPLSREFFISLGFSPEFCSFA